MEPICNDLAAEHAALDAVVADLDEAGWGSPTPAAGWDVKDTIVHLVQADLAAGLAVTDPGGFAAAKARIVNEGFDEVFGAAADRTGAGVLDWWRAERTAMLDAFGALGPRDRIPWFGPDMSALSFATARLMETWAHGIDVADSVGVELPATDRLRHVAHIGVTTRGWSYLNRGREVPVEPVRVVLTSPAGERWEWGPGDAASVVSGPALDFCLVVTQRRHRADTALDTTGAAAAEWMTLAQAFAGPPTTARPDRTRG